MTKRIISVLLALVLVLALSTSAMAATINVTNAVQGETYNAYKVFALTTSSTDSFAYQIVEEWREFFTTGAGAAYVDIDANGGVVKTEAFTDSSAAQLAKDAIAYAETKGIKPAGSATAEGTDPNGDRKNIAITVTDPGYYLVDTNIGSLMVLGTVTDSRDINDKNDIPTIDKKITNSDVIANTNDEKNSACVGDIVEYSIPFQAKKNSVTLKMEDTLSKGLTYEGSLVVTADGVELTEGTHYTAKTSNQSVVIEFSYENYLKNVTEADQAIVVTYKAKVNDDAVIGTEGNPNTVKLIFGRDGKIETLPQTVITYVFALNINKENEQKVKLADAKFQLFATEADAKAETNPLKFDKLADNQYKLSEDGQVTTITTDATGAFNVAGFGAGTYYIVETEAPAGYNKLTAPVKVTITAAADGTCTISAENGTISNGDTLTVLNQSGTVLPETGGIGTTIFYLVGGLMMAAAVVLLVAKKRTVNE